MGDAPTSMSNHRQLGTANLSIFACLSSLCGPLKLSRVAWSKNSTRSAHGGDVAVSSNGDVKRHGTGFWGAYLVMNTLDPQANHIHVLVPFIQSVRAGEIWSI